MEPLFSGTPLGPRKVSPEWKPSWVLLIINQKLIIFIRADKGVCSCRLRNLLQSLFQAARRCTLSAILCVEFPQMYYMYMDLNELIHVLNAVTIVTGEHKRIDYFCGKSLIDF